MIKSKLNICIIFSVFLMSCNSEPEIINNPTQSLPTSIKTLSSGFTIAKNSVAYNEKLQITSLIQSQENFATLTFNVVHQDDKVKSIKRTYRWHPQNLDTTTITNFDVIYNGNEIILQDRNSIQKMIFKVTNGFVDTFTTYYGANNAYFDTSVFKRDANNNIETISYFVTNETDTNLMVWKYSYSSFEKSASLDDVFNPVYYYSFSLYDPFMGALLGLKLSKEMPLKSSEISFDGSETERVKAQIDLDSGGRLKKLFYNIFLNSLPINDQCLEFEYN